MAQQTHKERLNKIEPFANTKTYSLAVIDAAYTGKLDAVLSNNIIKYINEPGAYYVNEPAYSLYDRFITHTNQLFSKAGLLQMLKVVEMAGGSVDKVKYNCLCPKGVPYKHIKDMTAEQILKRLPSCKDTRALEDYYAEEQRKKQEYADYLEHKASGDYDLLD